MKSRTVLTIVFALTLVSALGLAALSHRTRSLTSLSSKGQTFQVHGVVRSVDAAGKTIRIAHEEIPGYMPAMTMSIPVKDSALLKDLAGGDSVQFELLVTADDSWISHIERIPLEAPAEQTVDKSKASLEELAAERVRTGELVPDFKLIDQDGRTFRLRDFQGKAVLLTFIYTRCPLPNFCPLMTKNFAELQQRLSKEFCGKYQLLSISMDPEFDRPEVLKDYAARYEANPNDWRFATGDAESIQFVAGLMGLYFERENGLISHDLRTALIGPDGRLVQLWKSNVWTAYEVQRRVRELLTGSEDIATK